MKKYYLIVLSIISLAGILASCNGNGKTAEAGSEETVEKVATTGTLAGHDWVDLGLSVRWAICNVGANSPEEYGNYFAWGETTVKDNYTEDGYKYYNGTNLTKYTVGESDKLTSLDPSDDAAAANWGNGWRMPTIAELKELKTKCIWTWKPEGGYDVKGPNGQSIFLPAAGYYRGKILFSEGAYGSGEYWANSIDVDGAFRAGYIIFHANYYGVDYGTREDGLPIRAVCEK